MRFTMFHGALMLSLAVATGGCAMQKGKAEAAVASADSSLQAMAVEAQAYVPAQYEAAGAQVTAAKADLEAKSYADALTKAAEATKLAGELGPAIAARKGELTQTWQSMRETLPGLVQAIQKRVDELANMRQLPLGVTKDTVSQAKASLQDMTAKWTQAVEAQRRGDLATATTLATGVQAKATEVMAALRMKMM